MAEWNLWHSNTSVVFWIPDERGWAGHLVTSTFVSRTLDVIVGTGVRIVRLKTRVVWSETRVVWFAIECIFCETKIRYIHVMRQKLLALSLKINYKTHVHLIVPGGTGHFVAPILFSAVRYGQLRQEVCPTSGWYSPAGHKVHSPVSLLWYIPAAHCPKNLKI